jgi:hypothetical protein
MAGPGILTGSGATYGGPNAEKTLAEKRQQDENDRAAARAQREALQFKATHDEQGNPVDPPSTKIDHPTAVFYAQLVAAGGPMPSFGMGKVGAGNRKMVMDELVKQEGASGLTGADLAAQMAHYKAGSAQIKKLEEMAGVIGVNENNAMLNGQQFLDRSSELEGMTGYRDINSAMLGIQRRLPGKAGDTVSKMDSALNTFINEYAKVVSGSPLGSGTLSDSARHENMEVLQGNYPLSQKKAVLLQMKADMDNRTTSLNQGITEAYTRLVHAPGYVVPSTTMNLPLIKPDGTPGTPPSVTVGGVLPSVAAARQAEDQKVGLLDSPPAGAPPVGQNVKGFRFSPEGESTIVNYVQQPKATPEGYANLAADTAVQEGLITPTQRQDFYNRNLTEARQHFKDTTPEQRATTGNLGYGKADEQATKDAGFGTSVAQAISNVPASAVNIGEGLARLPVDLARTAISPLTDAGAHTIGAATALFHPVDTLKALGSKYSSLDNLKRSFITDPLGIPADIAGVASGVGGGLRLGSRLAMTGGRLGLAGALGAGADIAGTVARTADPMHWAGGAMDWASDPTLHPRLRGIADWPAATAGGMSGTGDWPLKQAAAAGYQAGRTGDTTALAALHDAMKNPGEAAAATAAQAKAAAVQLRDTAMKSYKAGITPFFARTANDTVDISDIAKDLYDKRPKFYDDRLSLPDDQRPPSDREWQKAWEQLTQHVGAAQINPALLSPEGLDNFKKVLRETDYNPNDPTYQGSLGRTLSDSVGKKLRDTYPEYDTHMANYGDFLDEESGFNKTFGLGKAPGSPIDPESVSRKLQAATRNNALTGYGLRQSMLERLATHDPAGTLLPAMAGQSLSPLRPRGIMGPLSGAGTLGGVAALVGGHLAAIPSILAGAVSSSPRVLGSAVARGAQAVGKGASAVSTIGDLIQPTRDFYARNREPLLLSSLASRTGADVDQTYRNDELKQKYLSPILPDSGS